MTNTVWIKELIWNNLSNRLIGRAVTRSFLEREVWGWNLGSVNLYTVLPTARQGCDISSKEDVLPGRNEAKMGPVNSLHALAYYSDYNERVDLIWQFIMNNVLRN